MNRIRRYLDSIGGALEKKAASKKLCLKAPEELHLELTFACNADCVMCNVRHLGKGMPELSGEEIKAIFDKAKTLDDIAFLVLSGGEPFLKKDFVEIVTYVARRFAKANILILSNFYDTSLVLDTLKSIQPRIASKRLSLGSSIDGLGSAHDRIRNRPGSFTALVTTLEALRIYDPTLFVSLNFTVTPENTDQIVPVFRWCTERGHHVSFQVMVQKKETKQFRWSDAAIAEVNNSIDVLIGEIFDKSGLRDPHALPQNKGLLSYLLSLHYIPKYIEQRKRFFPQCPCGEKYAMVNPHGDVYFCPVHKEKTAGNLRTAGFDALWSSHRAAVAREFFNKKKCHCWLTCTNGHMLGDALENVTI